MSDSHVSEVKLECRHDIIFYGVGWHGKYLCLCCKRMIDFGEVLGPNPLLNYNGLFMFIRKEALQCVSADAPDKEQG
jgi:hypothetical protein